MTTERRLVGLPDLVPLDQEHFGKSLGPGYSLGYFRFPPLRDRRDNCVVQPDKVANMGALKDRLTSYQGGSFLGFIDTLSKNGYHEAGHLEIGQCGGPMEFSEASGRDPVFFRWHKQISLVVRETLDNILSG